MRDVIVTFDPAGLTAAQQYGEACVVCHKKWPRPRIKAGRLPNDMGVFACDDCGPALDAIPLRPRLAVEA